MKKILVAVDGSEESQRAARLAGDIAVRFGAQLVLVHVVSPLLMPVGAASGFDMGLYEAEEEKAAEQLLLQIEKGLEEPGVSVARLVVHGSPAEVLAEEAKTQHADLVVVGSRGRGGVTRVLLGSVSNRLAHLCQQPVLIVR